MTAYRTMRRQLAAQLADSALAEMLLEVERNLLDGWDISRDFRFDSNMLFDRLRKSDLPAVRPANCDFQRYELYGSGPESVEFTQKTFDRMSELVAMAESRGVAALDLTSVSLMALHEWVMFLAVHVASVLTIQFHGANVDHLAGSSDEIDGRYRSLKLDQPSDRLMRPDQLPSDVYRTLFDVRVPNGLHLDVSE